MLVPLETKEHAGVEKASVVEVADCCARLCVADVAEVEGQSAHEPKASLLKA